MIKDYFRPESIEEALKILEDTRTIPIGGGTSIPSKDKDISVVDLQKLGLDRVQKNETQYSIGATATLESLLNYFDSSPDLVNAIKIEGTKNQRGQATLAGLVCTADGRSPLLTLLLALDLTIKWQPGDLKCSIGEFLAQRNSWNKGSLITGFTFDRSVNYRFESVGRSPYDLPIICIAIAKWPSNRVRVAAGGFGGSPILVIDGDTKDNLELAVENALLSSSDMWGSAEYRIAAASKLIARLNKEIT